jgi:hypothetical protein
VERGGYVLQSNDIAVARTSVQIPIENQFFVAALGVGYAVRDFLPPYGGGPHAVATENEGTNLRSCESAGAVHVVAPISAIRFGAKPPAARSTSDPSTRSPSRPTTSSWCSRRARSSPRSA